MPTRRAFPTPDFMVLLASLSTSLLIAALAVLVVVLGGGVAYGLAQSRRRAAADAEREAEEASQRDAELAHIRQRIEEIYERQQTGSETQFARVNQELEQLQMNLDAKGRQIDGVQGQLRYQLKRHEDEISELRSQLREAVEVFAAAALPAARPSAPALEAPRPTTARPATAQHVAAPAPSAPAPPAPSPAAPTGPPPAPAADDGAPVFAPLGELLKNDQELLDDLFSGTDLDSQDEADGVPPAPPTIAPIELSNTPASDLDTEQARPAPEEAPAAAPEPTFSSIPATVIAEQLESRDDFEFVEIDPPAFVSSPDSDAPPAASWPETADEEEMIDLTPTAAWPSAPAEAEPDESSEAASLPAHDIPAHSGDGMSSSGLDDPFAETSTAFHPEPATDLDSATLAPLPSEAPVAVPHAHDTEPLAVELAPVEEEPEAVADDPGDAAREDLTAITAVDSETQTTLYALGVSDIESIARWTRADARRMATQLPGVTEEDIMDRWIFEAQSILFERYQDELREQREQHLSA